MDGTGVRLCMDYYWRLSLENSLPYVTQSTHPHPDCKIWESLPRHWSFYGLPPVRPQPPSLGQPPSWWVSRKRCIEGLTILIRKRNLHLVSSVSGTTLCSQLIGFDRDILHEFRTVRTKTVWFVDLLEPWVIRYWPPVTDSFTTRWTSGFRYALSVLLRGPGSGRSSTMGNNGIRVPTRGREG